jgi:autotransporter-associated beta strand protein
LTGGIATFSPKIPNFGGTSTGGDFSLGSISELTPGSGIIMNGLRNLYLTGANTYTGPTTVSNGLMQVDGSLGIGPVTVAAGTLGGTGAISGPITIMSGGTLAPGASPGTLTVTSNLTLQAVSTSYFLLDKSVPTYSKIVGISNLTYNGTLVVSNLAGVLVTNDTLKLYDALAYSGSFTSSNLPTPTGLAWDTSGLTVNGTIKLVCSGTLTANAGPPKTFCAGGSAIIGGSPTASGGSLTGYTYGWSPAAGLSATNVANPTASPAITTTYTVTVTDTNGCTAMSSVLVTVNPNPTITLGANPAVCAGATNTNLTYSATTGAPDKYSIVFDSAAHTAGFVDVTLATLPASPIVITVPGGAAPATYNGTLTVNNSSSGCSSGSTPITVTVNATPTITLGANPSVCAGTTSANLPYSATTGSPDKYSIVFDGAAHTAGFVDVTLAALPASPIAITVPGGAGAGTYNGTLTVTISGTGCTSASSAISVTLNPGASISSGPTPSSQAVCSSSSATISVTASGGSVNYAWRKRGTGWGTGNGWVLSGTGSTAHFIGSSTDNDSGDTASNGGNDINTSGKAWAIFNNGGVADSVRTFSSPLAVGQTFSVDMDNGNIQGGGTVGLGLQTSTGQNRLEFYFAGGDTDYTVNDGSPHDSGISFTRTGVNVLVRLTGTDSYRITIKRYSDNATATLTGTLEGTAGTSIAQVRLFNASAGDCGFGCNNNTLYFNNLVAGADDDNAASYSAWNTADNFGNGPLLNGSPISGADTGTLTINPATTGNSGSYDVVVYNSCGQVTSSAATLSVNPLPTVYTVGGGGAYCSGGSGLPVTLSGSDIGIAYLLQTNGVYNGVTLPGTGAALGFNNQTTAATYTVLASNTTTTCSAAMSGNASVTINPLPVADAGSPQTIAPLDPVVIGGSPTASGGSGGGYSYSWSPATGLSSTTVANPTASPIVTTTYSVTVTDGNGCVSASSSVLVTVVVNPNPTNIVAYLTNGNRLALNWPADHIGWRLQGQTNGANVGLSNNWATVNGSASTNRVLFNIDQAKGTVFYRMIYP